MSKKIWNIKKKAWQIYFVLFGIRFSLYKVRKPYPNHHKIKKWVGLEIDKPIRKYSKESDKGMIMYKQKIESLFK